MDSSDWSNGTRYHNFDTRPDTELKPKRHPVTRHPVTRHPVTWPRSGAPALPGGGRSVGHSRSVGHGGGGAPPGATARHLQPLRAGRLRHAG
jgi:hypothetical protein